MTRENNGDSKREEVGFKKNKKEQKKNIKKLFGYLPGLIPLEGYFSNVF